MTTTTVSVTQLETYFKRSVGPVFCTPSQKLLNRFPLMNGMLGMVLPKVVGQSKNLFEVDWTLDANWPACMNQYPNLKNIKFGIEELNILKPGCAIPQLATDRYLNHKWSELYKGSIVCFYDYAIDKAEEAGKNVKPYRDIQKYIGVITNTDTYQENDIVMVSWSYEYHTKIIAVPKSLLIKVPHSFKPDTVSKASTSTSALITGTSSTSTSETPPKFKVGEVVIANNSALKDSHLGLIGIIKTIFRTMPTGGANYNSSQYEYTVNFNTLPVRNLSLCEQETASEICAEVRMRQWDLDPVNPSISDFFHLANYRQPYNRGKVWVPELKEVKSVVQRASPNKNKESGIELSIIVDNKSEVFSCREIDFKYDKDKLLDVLKNNSLTIGVENDKRNPNRSATKIYIYVFSKPDDVGVCLQYRILLGCLRQSSSNIRKFSRAIIHKRIKNPWNVYRYLNKKTLGYFYQICKVEEHVKDIPEFIYVD